MSSVLPLLMMFGSLVVIARASFAFDQDADVPRFARSSEDDSNREQVLVVMYDKDMLNLGTLVISGDRGTQHSPWTFEYELTDDLPLTSHTPPTVMILPPSEACHSRLPVTHTAPLFSITTPRGERTRTMQFPFSREAIESRHVVIMHRGKQLACGKTSSLQPYSGLHGSAATVQLVRAVLITALLAIVNLQL